MTDQKLEISKAELSKPKYSSQIHLSLQHPWKGVSITKKTRLPASGASAYGLTLKAKSRGQEKVHNIYLPQYNRGEESNIGALPDVSYHSRIYIIGHCRSESDTIVGQDENGNKVTWNYNQLADLIAESLPSKPISSPPLTISLVACQGALGGINSFAFKLSRALDRKGVDACVIGRMGNTSRHKHHDKPYLKKVDVAESGQEHHKDGYKVSYRTINRHTEIIPTIYEESLTKFLNKFLNNNGDQNVKWAYDPNVSRKHIVAQVNSFEDAQALRSILIEKYDRLAYDNSVRVYHSNNNQHYYVLVERRALNEVYCKQNPDELLKTFLTSEFVEGHEWITDPQKYGDTRIVSKAFNYEEAHSFMQHIKDTYPGKFNNKRDIKVLQSRATNKYRLFVKKTSVKAAFISSLEQLNDNTSLNQGIARNDSEEKEQVFLPTKAIVNQQETDNVRGIVKWQLDISEMLNNVTQTQSQSTASQYKKTTY